MAKIKHKITSYRATCYYEDYTPENIGGSNSVLFWEFSKDEFEDLATTVFGVYDPDRIKFSDRELFVNLNVQEPFTGISSGCSVKWICTGSDVCYLLARNMKFYRISPTEFVRNLNYWACKLCPDYDELRQEIEDGPFNKFIRMEFHVDTLFKNYEDLRVEKSM